MLATALMRQWVTARVVVCLAVALPLCAGAQTGRLPFSDEGNFSEAAVLRGVAATREQCHLASHAAWADAGRFGAECLRYWSAGLGKAPVKRVLVFFHGDVSVGVGKTNPIYLSSSIARQQADAERWGKQLGLPYIFFGRPGTHGSSGDHMQRRRPAESALISAALDRIKASYGVEEFVIAGQSGGGHVTSSLLTLRSDILCAVPTSAPSSPRIRWEMLGRSRDTTDYTDSYEPTKHIQLGRMHPNLRVFVLGNPNDRNVFWASQAAMAEALADAGVAVQVLHGVGSGPDGHGLSSSSRQVAAWCAKDIGTQEILQRAAKGLKG